MKKSQITSGGGGGLTYTVYLLYCSRAAVDHSM